MGGCFYTLTEEKTEGYVASADHELGYVWVTVNDIGVSSVFVPVATVSVDSRAVTEMFPAGMEYDPVFIGDCDEGIYGRLISLFE